jgi:hypothetical protein
MIWNIRERGRYNNSLAIERSDKAIIVPSARDIFTAEFRCNTLINGVTIINKPSVGVPSLVVSKYPLNLHIELQPPKTDVTQAACLVIGTRGNARIPIHGFSKSMQDHILVNNEWYPLDAGEIEEISDMLSEAGFQQIGPLTLKQYFESR